ncbi:hypothetical protein Aperf_G00000091462 [Anoplocephala perfoliata]
MPIGHSLPKLAPRPTDSVASTSDEVICNKTNIVVNGKIIGIKFDDLTHVKYLGVGHFAEVIQMRVKKGDEVYNFAVKELKILNSDVRASRVYMESEFGLRVSHCPFAVITYGVLAQSGCVRILMEIMDGSVEKLKTKLTALEIPWPKNVIAFITKCVVKGLDFLREQNIQHRDVKPTNMLVNRLGCVKICDYGVAQRMEDDTTFTTYVGTYMYMAPERLAGGNPNRGFRIQSDVWSLGLSVYELTAGYLPFPENLPMLDLVRYFKEHEDLEIPDDAPFTPEQREFLIACLKVNEEERPDYQTLLKMDFLSRVKIKYFRPVFAKFVCEHLGL